MEMWWSNGLVRLTPDRVLWVQALVGDIQPINLYFLRVTPNSYITNQLMALLNKQMYIHYAVFLLGQDTQLSQRLSPPRCINGYWQI